MCNQVPMGVFTSFSLSKCCYLHFSRKKFGSMLAQGYFKGQRSSINQEIGNFLWVGAIWTYWVATTWCTDKCPCLFFFGCLFVLFCFVFYFFYFYLITVACTLEISLGSCWHKDECMGQRSNINHNVQLFLSLNKQYAIIQWPLLHACTNKNPWCFYYS